MEKEWIDNSKIEFWLKNESKEKIQNLGDKICVSKNFQFCLFLRRHEAWEIKGEGWRSSNTKPTEGKQGRLILNFYHYSKANDENYDGSWFKMFVPLKYSSIELKTKRDTYQIKTNLEMFSGNFENHGNLMWNVMTGHAESELQIEEKFNLLNNNL